MGDGATRALEEIHAAWQPLVEAVDSMQDKDWGRSTNAGWTAKEMLAHVAFWDEAAVPVIIYMLRGQEIPKRPWFESGFQPPEDRDWPPDYEHNAREAGWGRVRASAEVRGRLLRAHAAMLEAVRMITDHEAPQRAGYLREQCDHYREHLAELQPLVER